ncbi:MAG: hypothetical protein E4H13_13225 [Calditrichales bacterium]|nr:MAG: hypothetical protein E4H13_13225 [Calditrichales bacterium]
MKLSLGQKTSIIAISRILPMEVLLKLKAHTRADLYGHIARLFQPLSRQEETEVDQLIDKEIHERKKFIKKTVPNNGKSSLKKECVG